MRPNAPALVAGATTLLTCAVACARTPAPASAPPSAPAPEPTLSPDTKIDFSTEAPEGKLSSATVPGAAGGDVDTGPPLRPRHKGVVLEATLGALGFAGQFRHVAPAGPWLHSQIGYEVLPWLMVFGEAELAYTDTSEAVDPSQVRAFNIWGFGAGGRATVHATDRVAFFGQLSLDALGANVPHDTLAILGYPNAESLDASFGARGGVEWYQMDRHVALSLQLGARDASGFAKVFASGDFPLLWDAALGFRYTF